MKNATIILLVSHAIYKNFWWVSLNIGKDWITFEEVKSNIYPREVSLQENKVLLVNKFCKQREKYVDNCVFLMKK